MVLVLVQVVDVRAADAERDQDDQQGDQRRDPAQPAPPPRRSGSLRSLRAPLPRAAGGPATGGVIGFVVLVAVVAEPGDEPVPGVVAVVVVVFAAVLAVGLRAAVLVAARVRVIAGRRGGPAGGLGAGVLLDPAPRRVRGATRIGRPCLAVARVVVQRLRP